MILLSEPAKRELVHNRSIELKCYARAGNLFDIEAHIRDVKPFPTVTNDKKIRPAEAPIHDMWLRITIDREFTITDIEAAMPTGAHWSCAPATRPYKVLVGLKISPGWLTKAKKLIERTKGCTHITELLQQLGTTAFQGVMGLNLREGFDEKKKKPFASHLVDTCYGLRSGGEIDQLRQKGSYGPNG